MKFETAEKYRYDKKVSFYLNEVYRLVLEKSSIAQNQLHTIRDTSMTDEHKLKLHQELSESMEIVEAEIVELKKNLIDRVDVLELLKMKDSMNILKNRYYG